MGRPRLTDRRELRITIRVQQARDPLLYALISALPLRSRATRLRKAFEVGLLGTSNTDTQSTAYAEARTALPKSADTRSTRAPAQTDGATARHAPSTTHSVPSRGLGSDKGTAVAATVLTLAEEIMRGEDQHPD